MLSGETIKQKLSIPGGRMNFFFFFFVVERDLQVQLGIGVLPKEGEMVVVQFKLKDGEKKINPTV